MADVKISELASATSLNDDDIIVGVNSGSTKKFSLARLRDFFKITFEAAFASKEHEHSRLSNGTYQVGMPTDLKKNETVAVKGDLSAGSISYDHISSDLMAENVQDAVDELALASKEIKKTADDAKTNAATGSKHAGLTGNPHKTTATDIGAIPDTSVGAAGGVASLDESGIVPENQLPIFVSGVTVTVENMALKITTTTSK